LSLPFWPTIVTTSEVTACLRESAMVRVISSGIDTSSRPVCSAASRVPRSVMIG
jgi:hypothetical protein